MNAFEHQINNIPHLVYEESDINRYLRAFSTLMASLDEDDREGVEDAMKDTVRFIADDAFKRGFEACHENIVIPLKARTVGREEALRAMRAYGIRCQVEISSKYEDPKGQPNSQSVEIEDVKLPEPKLDG